MEREQHTRIQLREPTASSSTSYVPSPTTPQNIIYRSCLLVNRQAARHQTLGATIVAQLGYSPTSKLTSPPWLKARTLEAARVGAAVRVLLCECA